jgi:hypothetical protein
MAGVFILRLDMPLTVAYFQVLPLRQFGIGEWWRLKRICSFIALALLGASMVAQFGGRVAMADQPSAQAGGGGSCYYYPSEGLAVNCTRSDFRMIDLKQQAEVAWHMEDWGAYMDLQGQMIELQDYTFSDINMTENLHVMANTPLRDTLGLDFKRIGENVRYLTAPGSTPGTNALLIYDKRGRDYKITASFCTSPAKYYANHFLMWAFGAAAGLGVQGGASGGLLKLVTGGSVVLTTTQGALADGSALYLAGARKSIIPNMGDCEYLVDILDAPNSQGRRSVYRNRVVIAANGAIDPTEWVDGVYWKNMGEAYRDENGHYVW